MFGNSKPFGTASAFGNSFGATSTPFGQNTTAFGAKPATSNVFGTSAFGVSTPNTGGLFGTSTPATGTGLFGQPSAGFGAPASASTGSFGFGGTSATSNLFGSSTPSTQSSGGLFGGSSTSAFGAPRPAFGGFGTSTQSTGLFGQGTSTGTGLFGSTGSFTTTAPVGTTVKFNPPTGTDTMMKGGSSTNISTRHQCITCMKEYENKSLEELRMEDYAANRKGSATGGIGGFGNPTPQTGLFGAPAAASTSAFSFGNTTQTKPLFGTTGGTNTFGSGGLFGQPAQNQSTGLFGKSVGFGTPTTSAAPAFNFGGSAGGSLFGQSNQAKPLFGQTTGSTGLFGNTATTQATGFGATTGFGGGFGAANQQSTGLFGAKPTGFGTTNTTTTNTFSFGNTNTMGNSLFGQKTTPSAFGTTSGFGAPSTGGFGAFGATQSTGTGLFGQAKPATSAFGGTGSTFGSGLGTSFGNPSFPMGLGTNTGTGLFGASTANKAPGFNFGNTGTSGFNFGAPTANTSSFNFGSTPSQMIGSDPNNSALFQQAQQQILALTFNPFGDSPLFRNPLKDSSRESEVLKPTNPSAQKALLNNNYFKVSLLPTAKIKPKPWSPPVSRGRVFFFDGLEDEEPSLKNISLQPKKSVKKLVLKNLANRSTLTVTSDFSSPTSQPSRIDVSISLKNPQNSGSSHSPGKQNTVPLTVDISNSSEIDNGHEDANTHEASTSYINASLSEEPVNISEAQTSTNSIDDSIAALHTNKKTGGITYKIWSMTDSTGERNVSSEECSSPGKEVSNESGEGLSSKYPIVLTKEGYFTIPSLDELTLLKDNDGNCFVSDFTVGRTGYGKVTFTGRINVAGLNIDEIVQFHKKEITVYPEDSKKPPVGEGLNRKAIVILENVWPVDKTNHNPIKDPERLSNIGYRDKIIRCSARIGAKFIDYIPESGSWIFEVNHFSKYGIEESDEEMETTNQYDPKLKKVPPKQVECLNGQLPTSDLQQLTRKPISYLPAEVEEMEGVISPFLSQKELDFSDDMLSAVYSPTRPIFSTHIDAERIQGMKASFFQEEMDEGVWDSCARKGEKSVILHRNDNEFDTQSFSTKKLDSTYQEISKRQKHLDFKDLIDNVMQSSIKLGDTAGTQLDWLSSFPVVKSTEESALQPKAVSLSLNKIYLKPLKKSVLFGKENLLSDAGYFMGRRFRVGWKAGGTFICIQPFELKESLLEMFPKFLLYGDNISSGPASKRSGFCLAFEKLQLDSAKSGVKVVQKNLMEILELQLKYSVSTVEKDVPLFIPKPGTDLIHALSELFESQLKNASMDSDYSFISQSVSVWNLLVSLWGKIRGLEDEQEVSAYSIQMARREALSHWLIKATENQVNKGISTLNQHTDDLQRIFLLLSGRRISDAVKLAQKVGNFHLSLLLSQAEGSFAVRKLLGCQLQNWEQNGAYKFIKYNMIVLYALLAGILLWENVYETVNCCSNLDWKQALALHLWYHCSPNASIQEAVRAYDEAFEGTKSKSKYSLPPYPDYIDASLIDEEMPDRIFDTCYHILKLYCDRTHRFDQLLMPETYTHDHLDYRLSWFLLLSLSSLGHNISSDLACTLHTNFASQLESINMWHWAIFVVLHYPDVEWRKKHAKDILLRHVSLESNNETQEKEDFLKSLLVPEKWIFEAKAIKAHSTGKLAEEAWFLLKAGFWSKSHAIVIKHLASDAVINEDHDYLMKYLSELAKEERCSSIIDWASGGQVYLDYINMCRMVQDVLSRETSAYDLETFTPQVISLCNRLSSVPSPTLKDRLSIAEMAKKTATILRTIDMLQGSRTKTSTLSSLASYFKNLPMPYDYAASENRYIIHSKLEEVTSELY